MVWTGSCCKIQRTQRALSERIRKLYENPEFRMDVAQKAAIVARKYDWARNAQQVREFLEHAQTRKKR